jgi:hypothetical protein
MHGATQDPFRIAHDDHQDLSSRAREHSQVLAPFWNAPGRVERNHQVDFGQRSRRKRIGHAAKLWWLQAGGDIHAAHLRLVVGSHDRHGHWYSSRGKTPRVASALVACPVDGTVENRLHAVLHADAVDELTNARPLRRCRLCTQHSICPRVGDSRGDR